MNKIDELESKIVRLKEVERKTKEELELVKKELFDMYNQIVPESVIMVTLPDSIVTVEQAEKYVEYRYPFYTIEEVDLLSGIAHLKVPVSYSKYASSKVERRVSTLSPVVDLAKLEVLDKSLYEKITSEERKFDEEKFEEVLQQTPQILGIVEQCLIAQKPRVSLHIVGEK